MFFFILFALLVCVQTQDYQEYITICGFRYSSETQSINLNSCRIPQEIASLTRLTTLSISGHSSFSLSIISKLTTLRTLSINNDDYHWSSPPIIDEEIPSEIGRLSLLSTLSITNIGVSGTIPSQIGSIISLLRLNLNRNQLRGSIPTEIGNLVQLLSLDLVNNKLYGTIPIQISNLSFLYKVSLSDNSFLTGILPTELGKMSRFREFEISSTDLRIRKNRYFTSVCEKITSCYNSPTQYDCRCPGLNYYQRKSKLNEKFVVIISIVILILVSIGTILLYIFRESIVDLSTNKNLLCHCFSEFTKKIWKIFKKTISRFWTKYILKRKEHPNFLVSEGEEMTLLSSNENDDSDNFKTSHNCPFHGEIWGHTFYICSRTGIDSEFSEKIFLMFNKKTIQKYLISQEPTSVFSEEYCHSPNESTIPISQKIDYLQGSKVIILIISEKSIEKIRNADKVSDNILLEYEISLELSSNKSSQLFPLFLGEYEKNDVNGQIATVKKFSYFNSLEFPDEFHCHRLSPKKMTIRDVMRQILGKSGIYVEMNSVGMQKIEKEGIKLALVDVDYY